MLIAKDISKVYGDGPSAVQALDRVTISFDSGMVRMALVWIVVVMVPLLRVWSSVQRA